MATHNKETEDVEYDPNSQYYADPNQYYYGYDYAYDTTTATATPTPDTAYNYDPQYYSQPYYNTQYPTQYIEPIAEPVTPKYTVVPASVPTAAVKTYYPSSSNPNNPVGPIIITKSGYAGPSHHHDKKKNKKKPVVRAAGGEVWEDNTLVDWDENDYRLFAGDLGNEVTEELLYKAFSKYPSLIRTRVVRDNRTMKSKGFGFISFKDPDDFVKAWREMNGKYVGNRPIKLRKSNWKERNIDVRAKKEKERVGPYPKTR